MNYILIDIKLSWLENFLDHVKKDTEKEYAKIEKKYEAGEYTRLDDRGNALSFPIMRQNIAVRAVYYELTAFIEYELQHIALNPWWETDNKKYSKYAKNLLESFSHKGKPLKLIWDLRFDEVIELIEECYNIKLDELPGGKEVLEIRNGVNAFKHRNGAKDFRKYSPKRIPEYYEPSLEDAYSAIDNSRQFLRALVKVCRPIKM